MAGCMKHECKPVCLRGSNMGKTHDLQNLQRGSEHQHLEGGCRYG